MCSIYQTILFISIAIICMNGVIETKKLKLVLVLFRHGDRNPVFTYPTDPYTDEDKYWPDGYNMLTAKGKQRMYLLGKYIRKRYKNYLTDSPREAYLRSSGKQRCLESASAVMAGLYPPVGRWQWNSDLGHLWQPFPINTVEFKKDGMLNPDAICPKAAQELIKIFKSKEVQTFWKKNEKLIQLIEEKTGLKFDHYFIGRDLFNLLEIQKSMNYRLPEWVDETVYESLRDFLEMAFLFDSSTNIAIKLRTGLLLKDMSQRLKDAKSDPKYQKMILYSTHDTQLTVFFRALDLYNNRSPPFGATVFLELYETNENNKSEHKLEVHYLNVTESEKTSELYIKDCLNAEKVCLLDQFFNSIKKWIPNDWELECKDDRSFVKKLFKSEL